MTSPLSYPHIAQLLARLSQGTEARARAEVLADQALSQHAALARSQFETAKQKTETAARTARNKAVIRFENEHERISAQVEEALKTARIEHGRVREEALETHEREKEVVDREHQEYVWTQDAVLEARVRKAEARRDREQHSFSTHLQTVATLRQETLNLLDSWKRVPPGFSEVNDRQLPSNALEAIPERIKTVRDLLERMKTLIAPKLLVGDRILWASFGVWVLLSLSAFFLEPRWLGPVIATLVTPMLGFGTYVLLSLRARNQVVKLGQPLFRGLGEVERLVEVGSASSERLAREDLEEGRRIRKDEVRKAEKEYRRQLADLLAERDATIAAADRQLEKLQKEYGAQRDKELNQLEAAHQAELAQQDQALKDRLAEITQTFEEATGAAQNEYRQAFASLAASWQQVVDHVRQERAAIEQENARVFPPWTLPAGPDWVPPKTVPTGIRFGSLAVDVGKLPGGQPSDPKLPAIEPAQFELPALLPFPHRCATLLHPADASRARAVQTLQAMMLRFLTALPPGKVRFTVIDPVGLGENFAAFMHLADYDEQLIGSRIWTETHQIERRLVDLTAHMENVIQKYLRNQYKSIEEYNQQAGEVAEPYRVLVVANFPANFSLEAARRLVSIASSGASCGVFTLVSYDARQPMPQGFPLSDLEQASLNLRWKGERFVWDDRAVEAYPLTLDAPPDPTTQARILQMIGNRAQEASRVEVDFEFIAPGENQWWSSDSRSGIEVPLGRAGATKRQSLRLGQGTSQHALIAGKTGSGKSTLLHALITNLALCYGPDEIELYLIDFKKGVEFKTYATYGLPHARVIAIESEREFGLSVLQRLDAELRRRADLFRGAGVQDIASYRDKREAEASVSNGHALPRILLIVDEFQEFFTEDDKLSQESALLLDRLVRQGRAFGLHVLLGSQTLGGAYSLARSTIDQMAVRIALQCSEADANLILSKDNNAARLLSRPGEAIYNDANGLIEGNDVFQVVWLPEDRRETYLQRLRDLAQRRHWSFPAPTIVFEGNHPSEIEGNHLLARLLSGGANTTHRERTVWLGEALAIKEPTAAVFKPQSGSNLLVIGQQPETARAVFAAVIAALAAHEGSEADSPGDLPLVSLLDGSPADDPQVEFFPRLAAELPGLVELVNLRDQPSALDRLAVELERRQQDPRQTGKPLFLAIYGIQRFRDLRKAEDDFSFGRREDKPVAPSERLAALIREGPPLGIHTIVWCDSLLNAQRALDRSGLREFELRVLFQMGISDSSTLIDTPLASRLGANRALFASEEMSAPEKFRPYRLPEWTWLRDLRRARPRAGQAAST